jgi:RNA polymerase sigma factor (sigma-70 family)
MDEWLAEQFEENRGRLRGVAYRMLGSASEADDAVQEAWMRLSRSGAERVDNLRAWLTTIVGRICLDILRARTARREEPLEEQAPEMPAKATRNASPEDEAVLADSVGLALLVVLERLAPAERLAFVLHDMFDLSFDEIASILGRSPVAARQLASRARRRVRGGGQPAKSDVPAQRRVVDAFLAALRAGDLEGLVAVLHPEVQIHSDRAAALPPAMREVHGARAWAEQAIRFAKGARAARPAIVNGNVGVVIAPHGRLFRVLQFTIDGGRIAGVNVIGEPASLDALHLAILDD